jgi:F-type H+-transporting ATPase subunit gamma
MQLNEIKDQQDTVRTIGSFANSLQQVAAMRMIRLRQSVLNSKAFVREATLILRELYTEREKHARQIDKKDGTKRVDNKTAIIAITSDIGLCGSYNTEIFTELDQVIQKNPRADFFIIGKKGQNHIKNRQKVKIRYFPFNIPEQVSINDLKPLLGMFYYYPRIFLLYNKYINTTTREVEFVQLAVPNITDVETEKEAESGKYTFEPDIDELIASISARIRFALFRQQILDSKLALYTSQMIAMKTASDNAGNRLEELSHEYNKTKRKLVDKKIQEIQAGRSLWATPEAA